MEDYQLILNRLLHELLYRRWQVRFSSQVAGKILLPVLLTSKVDSVFSRFLYSCTVALVEALCTTEY